jgi:hypothetical protein
MAQLDDMLTSDLAKGVMIGLGLAVLVPLAATAMAPMLRPMARSALKAGLIVLEKGREAAAELGEMAEDVMAEVQDELRAARQEAAAAPPGEAAAGETGPGAAAAGNAEPKPSAREMGSP